MAVRSQSSEAVASSSSSSTLLRKTLVVMLVVANVVVFGGIAWVWYWAGRASSQVATIAQADLPSIDAMPPQASEPRNFLLIGSDSREQIPEDFPNFFGPADGQRADVVMIVHVSPEENRVQILSLPRDLKVEIPGHGEDKINAAYALGGPDLMVQTVKEFTDLPIHHYVELDFVGFAQIVDALGGVTMYFPYEAFDEKSGLSIGPGCEELNGAMALAYARSRSYQELRDGSWVLVEADDLGRIRRQQRLIFAILEEAKRPSTLAELGALVSALGEHVAADSGLANRAMVQLAWELRGVGPANTVAVSLPVEFAGEGDVSYVVAQEPEASRMLTAFRLGRELMVAPAVEKEGIELQVLNGNGRDGSASDMADLLQAKGFVVSGIADAESSDYGTTLAIGRAEELSRAEQVIEALGFGRVVPGEVPSSVDVIVIVGQDSESSLATAPTSASTITTAPASTAAPADDPTTSAPSPGQEVALCG